MHSYHGARWRSVVSFTHTGDSTSGERAPGTLWIGGFVGPRAGLDAVVKRKIRTPARNLISLLPVLLHWCENWSVNVRTESEFENSIN
jgi:hypothetical protein